ncbi:MAG TPA: ABC transporter permease [Acidimicrobiales bacterium]|nr:ABC transporter permease [Acidimicrobiales bacterium]
MIEAVRGARERADSLLTSPTIAARAGRAAALALAYGLVMKVVFNPPPRLILFGIANGALYGLIAIGVILIYRTNKIINFAAAAIGAIPGIFAVLLNVKHGVPYFVSLAIAIVCGLAMGAIVDFAVIRQFPDAPRLILTVATLGVVQILAVIAVYEPKWLGADKGIGSTIPTPWKRFVIHDSQNTPIVTGDHIFAVLAVVLMSVGLAAFFRYTRMGIALRASAENADRALLLGIPVRRVGTVAWMLAGLFGTMVFFLRAPLNGLPTDGSLGFNVLLFTLACAVIARLDRLGVAIVAGMGIGILEQASVVKTGSGDLGAALMLFIVLAALLLQRKTISRALDTGASTWQAVKEIRPTPQELRHLPEVRIARGVLAALALGLVLGAPWFVGSGNWGRLSLIPIYAIIAVSLVILTGWAGQVSLGQFGLVGAGAVVAGGLVANHNIDFFAACAIGVAAGVVVAVLIGIPALRVQGLFLAITTMAFGGAMEFYFLKDKYWTGRLLLPDPGKRVERPVLWGRISIGNDRAMYYLSLVALGLVLVAARSFRRNRSGRVLIAARDNLRAAPAYGINLARARLAAFAVSGGIAALAGVLLAYNQGAVDAGAYGIFPSITIFLVTVIGGLTSLSGAVYGVVAVYVGQFFVFQWVVDSIGPTSNSLLRQVDKIFTGPGLLLGLLFLPGGYSEALFRNRDKFLLWVAERHDIIVPSLRADRRVETEPEENTIIEQAERHVEEADTLVHADGAAVQCPVCDAVLGLDQAAAHEHLRVPVGAGEDQ